jgi:hypothetical protein
MTVVKRRRKNVFAFDDVWGWAADIQLQCLENNNKRKLDGKFRPQNLFSFLVQNNAPLIFSNPVSIPMGVSAATLSNQP